MQDLGFIKNCDKCNHNISFTEKDIIKEYSSIGYIIVYKPMGRPVESSLLCENSEILAQRINALMSPQINSYCDCSGIKIHKILRVLEYKHYIICPNCGEKILLEEGTFETHSKNNFLNIIGMGWSGYYYSSFSKDAIWYSVESNGKIQNKRRELD